MPAQPAYLEAVDADDEKTGLAPRMGISVFDLDRTLTRRPTYSAFLISAAWQHAPWRLALIPALLPWAIGYALGLVSRRRTKAVMHRLMLGRAMPRAALDAAVDTFAERVARRGLHREAPAQIAAERAAGRRVMLATAAPEYYARAIAKHVGIDEVVATRACWRGERLHNDSDGENCRGPIKRHRLVEHLRALGIDRRQAHLRFFSDAIVDLPCFDYCDEAVAVNPDRKLRALATACGWRILDWRAARA